MALLAMRISRPPAAPPTGGILNGLVEGLHYAFGSGPIRTILSLVAMVSLASMPLAVLLPVLAGDVLHGDAATLGLLTAASGLVRLAGGLSLAMKKTVLGLGKLMALTTALLGAATIGVALSHWLPLSLLLLAMTGFAMMVEMAAGNTILQTIVEEDKRGRVMSLYTAAFMGLCPGGKPSGRRPGQRHGHAAHTGAGGACVPRGRGRLRGQAAAVETEHTAHLHPGGDSRRSLLGHRIHGRVGRPAGRLTLRPFS